MTDRSESTRAPRTGGWPLVRVAVLALLAALASTANAQPVLWEAMPGVRELPTDPDPIVALDFLYGEGAQADDPTADTLVVFSLGGGAFLYNPSGRAGAAGDNGVYGVWHQLCSNAGCTGPQHGIVTAAGTVLVGGAGSTGLSRGADRGRTWAYNIEAYGAAPFFESALAGPAGARAIVAGPGDDGRIVRSLADGAPGTWAPAGTGFGLAQSFGEVPPSAALPNGRLLMGVWNGAVYSDNGGTSFTRSNAYGQARYIVYSFTFMPQSGHPYGGVAFAGMQNVALSPAPNAEVHRSDDGGATWSLVHRFTAEETGQPETAGANVAHPAVLATSDGALWAGVSQRNGAFPNRGGIMRSVDGGVTWARADAGFDAGDGRGYRVNELRLGRDGRLYAATQRGVWRTTAPVVADEASPVDELGVAVSVRPNPAGGRVEVVVSLAAAQAVRVVVLDALGREVAVVLDGAASAGDRTMGVDTASWPAGVYVLQATSESGRTSASSRFTVVR